MAGDTARTSSEATDTRRGVADKDFAERLIKLGCMESSTISARLTVRHG
jgi:hypothetical protein